MNIKPNAPAHPEVRSTDYLSNSMTRIETVGGLTVRARFMESMMQSLIVNPERFRIESRHLTSPREYAIMARVLADALIDEINKPTPTTI